MDMNNQMEGVYTARTVECTVTIGMCIKPLVLVRYLDANPYLKVTAICVHYVTNVRKSPQDKRQYFNSNISYHERFK